MNGVPVPVVSPRYWIFRIYFVYGAPARRARGSIACTCAQFEYFYLERVFSSVSDPYSSNGGISDVMAWRVLQCCYSFVRQGRLAR